MTEQLQETESASKAVQRFKRWAAIAVAVAVLGYVGYALVRGLSETGDELRTFPWLIYLVVLGLTLVNYGLRGVKWAYLLTKVGVKLPWWSHFWIFTAGLAMVISPAKAGELLKPYLVREITGVEMSRTIPVLVAERFTDGLAVLMLASFGVAAFLPEKGWVLVSIAAVSCVCLAVIAFEPLALSVLRAMARLPLIGGVVPKLEVAYQSLRTCLAPGPLLLTMALSLVAWWAECVGAWIIFVTLSADLSLEATTFLYAFATLFGAPSPGGLGMSDLALVEGAMQMSPALTGGAAVAGALLIRVATLWFGVILGGLVLFRIDTIIAKGRAWVARNPPQ